MLGTAAALLTAIDFLRRIPADFFVAFFAALAAALAGALFVAARFLVEALFAAFFAGVAFAALTAAQRFFCAAAMRFLASGLNLLRCGDSLAVSLAAGASVSTLSAGIAVIVFALTAAQRFLCAAAMRLREAGLNLVLAGWTGAAELCVTAAAALVPESAARACRSLPNSSSIAAMITFSSITTSQAREF